MVLGLVAKAWSYFPQQYVTHSIAGLCTVIALHTISQGRKTDRERDLHARVILVTGGFTPLGVTVLQNLAERGAHVIALCQDPIDAPNIALIIDVLRTTTKNESVYAEECDLHDPNSINDFCAKFLKGQDKRLDAILFMHEYRHLGSPRILNTRKDGKEGLEKERRERSLATFLLTTLLLPSLLVAPTERDIRIVNVVNRFYAAAAGLPTLDTNLLPLLPPPTPSPSPAPRKRRRPPPNSTFLSEGRRALRTTVFTRHLQRILDALPAAQVPKAEANAPIDVASAQAQKSNIVAVTVSPGLSRVDTVAAWLNADWSQNKNGQSSSWLGILIYILLLPLLRIFTKSPTSAMQSILHVLFLPTPFKVASRSTDRSANLSQKQSTSEGAEKKQKPDIFEELKTPEEVLKPGALYAECAVVRLKVPPPAEPPVAPSSSEDKGKGKEKDTELEQETMDLPDDGELGGELCGRKVWEAYEEALKAWQLENPAPPTPPEPTKAPEDTDKI